MAPPLHAEKIQTHIRKQSTSLSFSRHTHSEITSTRPPQTHFTHTRRQQLEERPLKLKETHLTSIQGHRRQTQTSMEALGSQSQDGEEEKHAHCHARDEERERLVAAKMKQSEQGGGA